jgi:hypothetical protein
MRLEATLARLIHTRCHVIHGQRPAMGDQKTKRI